MEKIKVLMVLGNTRRGGTQSFIMNVLQNIDRDRFQIDLAINLDVEGGWGPDMKAFGCNIYIFPYFKVYNWLSFATFWKKFFNEHHYDIVHGHSTNSAGIYLGIAKQHGCVTIAHVHSTGLRGNFFERVAKRWFRKFTRKQADYWFACTEEAAQKLYGDDYKSYVRYYEMPNGINLKRYVFNQNARDRIRKELGLQEDTFLCGHVGTFSVPKNHSFLIDIFAKIVKRNNKAQLLLIGEGILKDKIIHKVKTLGLLDRIIFIENISNVNEYLMAMDVMILPSLFEGFSYASLEGQTTGLNVVQSDTIPKDCILTDCVEVLPLSQSASYWADKALGMPQRKRETVNGDIVKSKYNIDYTISLISKLYQEMFAAKQEEKL